MMYIECKTDKDCLQNTYCYTVSNVCAFYVDCSKWYRVEAAKPARNPLDCGQCKPGYIAINTTFGGENDSCQKIYSIGFISGWVTLGIIFLLVLTYLFTSCKFLKKFWPNNQNNNFERRCNTTCIEVENECCNVTASAPPEEQDLFAEGKHSAWQNNNKEVFKDTNQFQSARGYCPPSWIRNANYGTNQVDFDSDVINNSEHENTSHQVENHNPENNNQLSTTCLTIDISRNGDNQNNARNTEISQINPFNNSSNTDSIPRSNENGHKKKSPNNVIINQSLNHNITMNVNVFNGEEY